MVEILKESVIRVQSSMNEWMDCVFVVSKEDEEKAHEVLSKAWDSFWEDGDGWCYGNYLEAKMVEAGIAFDAYYADTNEYEAMIDGLHMGRYEKIDMAGSQGTAQEGQAGRILQIVRGWNGGGDRQ